LEIVGAGHLAGWMPFKVHAGWMPFMLPNQQLQSIEEYHKHTSNKYSSTPVVDFFYLRV